MIVGENRVIGVVAVGSIRVPDRVGLRSRPSEQPCTPSYPCPDSGNSGLCSMGMPEMKSRNTSASMNCLFVDGINLFWKEHLGIGDTDIFLKLD